MRCVQDIWEWEITLGSDCRIHRQSIVSKLTSTSLRALPPPEVVEEQQFHPALYFRLLRINVSGYRLAKKKKKKKMTFSTPAAKGQVR